MSETIVPDWNTALALQDRGRTLEALAHFRGIARRLARTRDNPSALMETARRLCGLYDRAAAMQAFEALAEHAGRPPSLLIRIGLILRQEGWFSEASEWARGALNDSRDPATAVDARLLLAECAERLGALDESLALADEVLASHPGSIPARRQRAAVLRRRGRLDEAHQSLSPLLLQPAQAHWETCRAWFELGHVQDARGNHDAAWQAWTQARRHYPPNANWNLYRQQAGHVWRHVQAVHQSITRAHFESWAGAPDASAPPLAILTGHPRSGTTLLEQALDAHSGITSVEETTIFTSAVYRPLFQHGPPGVNPATHLDALTPDERSHWSREYHGLSALALGQALGRRMLLDKNPDLLQLLPALLRIFPSARIVVMLRDPRDILVSMFAQALPPNHTSFSYRNVRAAGQMVALRLALWHQLRDRLPATRFHEVRYEAAATDFPLAVQGTLRFLGLPLEPATLDPAAHSRRRIVHSPTFAAVQEPVHTRAICRWKQYRRWIDPAMDTLRPVLAELGYDPDA